MDFSLSKDQEALRDLTAQIVGDVCTAEYLRRIAGTEPGTDAPLWRTLADAGLVGIGLPESVGGGGQSWLETCIVLSELARASAPVPALATMAFTAPSLAASGSHDELVARVATGETVVAAAVHEPTGDPFSAAAATVDGGLHGTKICVLHGTIAEAFVVTAIDGLHLVWADAPGVTVETQTTSSDAPDALVTFRGSPSELLAGPEGTALLIQRGLSAACVMTAAACEAALKLVADYTTERRQFDQPIASFQAVSQRAADAYIDTEAVRLTAWQAAWRLAEGLPCEQELLTAKFWAAEGGWRAMHAALHLHGGVGVDRNYPLHRHVLLHKQLELHLGSATPTLQRLGRLIAE